MNINIYKMEYKNNFDVENFRAFINSHKETKYVKVACKGLDYYTMDEILKVAKQIILENTKDARIDLGRTVDGSQKNDDITVKVTVKIQED